MRRRHLPQVWLFVSPRIADLPGALARLPRGSGVVVEGPMPPGLIAAARRRGLVVVTPGARGLLTGGALRIGRAHGRAELVAARRAGADAAFLSPVFPTRSHPGARALGPVRFGWLARAAKLPVFALGGMSTPRFRHLQALGASGWGGIDAFTCYGTVLISFSRRARSRKHIPHEN